jgi:hypothetical protein
MILPRPFGSAAIVIVFSPLTRATGTPSEHRLERVLAHAAYRPRASVPRYLRHRERRRHWERCRNPVLRYPPFRQQHSFVQVARHSCKVTSVRIVRHHHNGFSMLLVQSRQKCQDLIGRTRIEIAGGFIGEDQVRIGDYLPWRWRPAAPGPRIVAAGNDGSDQLIRPIRAPWWHARAAACY